MAKQKPIFTRIHTNTITITINRPEVRNAINFEVMNALERMVAQVEQNDDIRVLILRGAGNSFVSGGDLKNFHSITNEREAELMAQKMLHILERIEKLPCWTIACINGDCYGGGGELALAFDFRISYPEVTLGFTQSRFYLPPGWGGLTRLTDQVGRSKALEWLAGSECIDGKTALQHNFLNRLAAKSKLTEECKKWADTLSKNDRTYIGNLKTQSMPRPADRKARIENETAAFTRFWVDKQHVNRVDAFLAEKKGSR